MSTTIDERVVEMRFDNKHFEKNVQTTLSTLDKLKAKLNLSGASKGLENVSTAAKKVDLSSLVKSIEPIEVKFNSLSVIATTALTNITNSAINAGKRILSALTIDPVKTGFSEYETQINAVQTILANTSSKGTTLDQVNAALDQLNKYADKTIYNFTEMTRNIGTFTAAGIDLDTSVSAIQGIANLAAVSGSTSQQASTAMYQLSQALASGTVKLMDWNSVVNAGMGGQVFQDALKETARLHGVAIDQIIDKQGSFRESLSEGWLSAEILTETLKKFTTSGVNEYLAEYTGLTQEAVSELRNQAIATGDTSSAYKDLARELAKSSSLTEDQIYELLNMSTTAEDAATKVKTFTQLIDTMKEAVQSGWTQTWEILVGDFEESKELFTEISDVFGRMINDSAEARNSLLEGVMSSNWDKFAKHVEAAGISVGQFQNDLIETGKAHGKVTDEMISEAGSFEKSLKSGWLSKDIIVKTLNKYIKGMDNAGEATSDMTNKLKKFEKVVDEVILGKFGNGEERVRALTDAGYEYSEVQELVNKVMAGGTLTLEDMSDAQLKSIGYTDAQIEKIRDLEAQASRTNTPINELINNLNKPSGRELLIDAFRNALTGFTQVITAVKNAWAEVFPADERSDGLYSMIEGLHDFSENLVVTEETVDKLTRTIKGFFSLTSLFSTFTSKSIKIIVKTIKGVLGLTNTDILGVLANVGDAIVAFRNALFNGKQLDVGLEKISQGLIKVAKAAGEWFNNFWQLPIIQDNLKRFSDAFVSVLGNFKDHFKSIGDRFNEFIQRVKEIDSITIDDLDDIFKDFRDNVVAYFLDIGGKFSELGTAVEKFKADVKKYFEEIGWDVDSFRNKIVYFVTSIKKKFSNNIGFGEIFAIGTGAGLIIAIKKIADALETLADPLSTFKKIGKGVTGVLESFSKKLDAAAWSLKAEAVLKIAQAIGILAISAAILSKVNVGNLLAATVALGILAGGLLAMATAIDKFKGTSGNIAKISISLSGIATAVLLFVAALKGMENLNSDGLVGRVAVLFSIIAALTGAAIAMSKYAPQLSKGSLIFIAFAAGIKILVSALEDITMIDSDKIAQSLSALTVIMAGLAGLMVISGISKSGFNAVGILATVISLKILIGMLEDISNIDTQSIKDNIGAFIAIFGMYAVLMMASYFAGKNAAKAGVGILGMSAAMILIITSFKMMAKMDAGAIEKTIGAILTVLLMFGGLVAASYFAGENAAKAGLMIVSMAGAILLMTGAMVVLSHVPAEGLDRAVEAIMKLELMFALLIGSTYFAKGDAEKTITKIAVTIGILALALGALSMIESTNLAGATAALSMVMVMFGVLIGVTSMAQSASGTIIALTVAVVALGGVLYLVGQLPTGKAMEAAGALSLLLIAFTAAFAILGEASAPSIKALAALGVMTLVMAGLALILKMLDGVEISLGTIGGLAAMLVLLSGALVVLGLASPILAPLAPILLSLATAFAIFGVGCLLIATSVLMVSNALLNLSQAGYTTAEDIKGAVAAIVSGIITGLVGGLIEGIGLVVQTIVNLATTMVQKFKEFLGINSPSTVFMSLGKFLIEGLINGVLSMGGSVLTTITQIPSKAIEAIKGFVGNFTGSGSSIMTGLLSGIRSKISTILSTVREIPAKAIAAIRNFIGKFKESGLEIINGFISGIRNKIFTAVETVKEIPAKCISALKEKVSGFKEAGKDVISGFIKGIKEKASAAVDAAKGVVKSALEGAKRLLGINSPSKEFEKIGIWSDEGLIHGLLSYASKVASAGKEVGNTALNSVSKAIAGISDAMNNIDSQPTIRPVLDISEIEAGTSRINALFSKKQAISISAGMSRSGSTDNQNGVNAPTSGGTFNFTQINNSPKALDRIEIYRQTNNQISTLKEVVNAT